VIAFVTHVRMLPQAALNKGVAAFARGGRPFIPSDDQTLDVLVDHLPVQQPQEVLDIIRHASDGRDMVGR